jgi:hypothetical protein
MIFGARIKDFDKKKLIKAKKKIKYLKQFSLKCIYFNFNFHLIKYFFFSSKFLLN